MAHKRNPDQHLPQVAQSKQPSQYELLVQHLNSGAFCRACEPQARLVILAVESTGNPASQEGSAEILNGNVIDGGCNLARRMGNIQMNIGDLLNQAF